MLADYARKGHPDFGWLLAALLGLLWTFGFALITRYVSPKTSPRFGGKKLPLGTVRAADPVKKTLDAIRDTPEEGPELREQARADWRARAISAHDLSTLKGSRLR